jgi:type I restriction enzyme S subunit
MSSKTKTKTQKDETSPKLMPKLRFPGFSGSWTCDPLSRVLKEHKLKNTEGRDVFSVSMEYGIVNQIELLGRSYAAAETSHYTIGRRFDVVYTKSPLKAFPFGIVKQCKFDGEVALSPLYGVFTPPNPHLGLMIEAYFESPYRSKDFLSPLCQKGAKNTLQITNTTFLSGRMPLPTEPAEQQRIASCLSSLDSLITAHTQKLSALKTYKKGLMQQLFPREGETVPRLRFPEFKNAGEWDYAPLGQLLVGRPDYGVNVAAVPFSESLPKYLRITDISEDGTYLSDKMVSVDIEPTAGNYLDEGDIVLTRTGASVGKSYRYRKEDGRLVFAGFLIRIRPVKMKLVSAYLATYLTTDRYWDWVTATSARSGQPGINSTEYSSLSIPLPPGDLAEQQRIATCLTSLDDLINVQKQKIEFLKTHKKGLMQGLFPNVIDP